MLMRRALILLGLCVISPAYAGLFSDDDARKNIQQVEVRTLKLEEQDKLKTQSVLDLQGQIDVLNGELRKLRGQNEEIAHGLQDAEKREKDFYVDLDARLRHFESAEAASASVTKPVDEKMDAKTVDPDDPAVQNRAIEVAYGLVKAGNNADSVKALQDFLKKFPGSVHTLNASYWLAGAQFALKDYKSALPGYREYLKIDPESSREPDVLFNIASCQQELKSQSQATATLKQLIAKYPKSAAAAKAKKILSSSK
jgi:tol-pal system protein YbgF